VTRIVGMRRNALHYWQGGHPHYRIPGYDLLYWRTISHPLQILCHHDKIAFLLCIRRKIMPFVYTDVDNLNNKPKVGSKQCVALLQHYVRGMTTTHFWQQGDDVIDNTQIAKGTAIATFVNGRYQSLSHGNHAALFISQDAGGIWVMDQWSDDRAKPRISRHYIPKRGKNADGKFIDPSNNADAYSIIK
jgi:hypothetical protein